MILDTLDNAENYFALNPRFKAAFQYLKNPALNKDTAERIDLEDDQLYALTTHKSGKKRHEAKLEAHRKYIDIQFVLGGIDSMGWRPARTCTKVESPYSEEKDIAFFADEPMMWFPVHPGTYAIFFPEDAHAPMVSDGEIHKIIVKVAI
jgi:YhcH/YjgK/YiaL family protein